MNKELVFLKKILAMSFILVSLFIGNSSVEASETEGFGSEQKAIESSVVDNPYLNQYDKEMLSQGAILNRARAISVRVEDFFFQDNAIFGGWSPLYGFTYRSLICRNGYSYSHWYVYNSWWTWSGGGKDVYQFKKVYNVW
ncbi:hypothetical protein IW492_13920 [Enterococcus sp. BWB1-3]|uniref:hypothetical protein n=1 Tax=unclassified Enterococcus TaxID=2608891 RepID=UPI001920630B|nr:MULTISPECIES: hypothetical protein [unclassified Enterococcus]MBL1230330.1 hypothetical protein [Enterococcus sp. BWB1-3]MCB5951359.1 hypothetical protein [Enterococcus sp. BWT-B8]